MDAFKPGIYTHKEMKEAYKRGYNRGIIESKWGNENKIEKQINYETIKRLEQAIKTHEEKIKGYKQILSGLDKIRETGYLWLGTEKNGTNKGIDLEEWNEETRRIVNSLKYREIEWLNRHKGNLEYLKKQE